LKEANYFFPIEWGEVRAPLEPKKGKAKRDSNPSPK
jgi:hypothetical protein